MITTIEPIIIILTIFSFILFLFCVAVGAAILSINSYIKKIYTILENLDEKNSISC